MFKLTITTQDSTGFTELFVLREQTIAQVNEWLKNPFLVEIKIVREEYIEIVKAEITRKIRNIGESDFNYLQNSAFQDAAKEIILQKNGINDWSNDFIKPIAVDVITKRVEKAVSGFDWKKSIDDLAKQKIKDLIK